MKASLKFGFGALLFLGLLAFVPLGAGAEEATVAPQVSAADDLSPAGELALWNSIKDTDQADNFLNYLNKFPNGMFFDPAKSRYELLSGKTFVPDPNAKTMEPEPKPADTTVVTPEKKPVVAKAKAKPAKKVTKRTSSSTKTAKLKKKKPNQLASTQSRKKVTSTKATCKKVKTGQTILYYNKSGCPVVALKKAPVKRRAVLGSGSSGGSSGGGSSGGSSGGGWGG